MSSWSTDWPASLAARRQLGAGSVGGGAGSVGDGAGSDLHRELVAGDLLVNVLGDIHNQGCRPCGAGRYAYAECRPWDLSAPSGVGDDWRSQATNCHAATAYVGPLLPARDAPAGSMFVAQFGVTPYVVAVELSDPRTVDQAWSVGRSKTTLRTSPRP